MSSDARDSEATSMRTGEPRPAGAASPAPGPAAGTEGASPASESGADRRLRVVLADNQPEIRSALRLLLEEEAGLAVAGEAADSAALLSLLAESEVDLVLLDWELPGLAGPSLLESVRRLRPALPVVALSGRPEARGESLAAGADAFVSKGEPPERLLATVREIGGRGRRQ